MKHLLFFIYGLISCLYLSAQPKHEIRAVWLTTNYALDWPGKPIQNATDITRQKQDFCRILDQLKAAHFNLVFLQTRIRGNVIYPSKIEPWSPFIKKGSGIVPDYDPLAYAIEACHERGMECHAWFVTYPLGMEKVNGKANNSPTVIKNKDLVRKHSGELYLDPGHPRTNEYLLSLVKEIVSQYDIDGFHLDYIRYPDKCDNFPDQTTYRLYGNKKEINSWRRENINRFVYSVYDTIKSMKPWVQVSSSVLGMYQKIAGNTQKHWTAYSSVFQDPADWLKKGKHDFIVPMMYYSDNLFFPFVHNWLDYSNNRFVVPGIGLYRMDQNEGDWAPQTVLKQIEYCRINQTHGNAYYRTQFLLENKKGILREITSQFYKTPALLPAFTWLDSIAPAQPVQPAAVTSENSMLLNWEKHSESITEKIYYNVYRSDQYPVDTENPNNLVATQLIENQLFLPINNQIESGYYYLITASDRYHNESMPSPVVYFCTGNFEK